MRASCTVLIVLIVFTLDLSVTVKQKMALAGWPGLASLNPSESVALVQSAVACKTFPPRDHVRAELQADFAGITSGSPDHPEFPRARHRCENTTTRSIYCHRVPTIVQIVHQTVLVEHPITRCAPQQSKLYAPESQDLPMPLWSPHQVVLDLFASEMRRLGWRWACIL